MKIIEFHIRITKIMKMLEFQKRIIKSMKILQLHANGMTIKKKKKMRITNIMTILKFHRES